MKMKMTADEVKLLECKAIAAYVKWIEKVDSKEAQVVLDEFNEIIECLKKGVGTEKAALYRDSWADLATDMVMATA
jgi:hypothetical protein